VSAKLIVSANFLASQYAPSVCLFTGDTEHVTHDLLRVMSGRPGYAADPRLILTAWLSGLSAITLIWWTLRRQLVSMRVLKGAAEVEIEFPRRLVRVHRTYREAYARYVADGSPPPAEPDPAEDWPETVQPGWDESGCLPVIRL